MRRSRRLKYAVRILHGFAVGLALTAIWQDDVKPISWFVVGLLGCLALMAELMPVQFARIGIRVTLTLPFIAGSYIAAGASGAILVDLVVTLLATYILSIRCHEKIQRYWLGVNMSTSACAASLASLVANQSGRGLTSGLVFVLVYTVVNFGVVSSLNGLFVRQKLSTFFNDGLKLAVVGILIYGLFAMAVTQLVVRNMPLFLPLTLWPVLMMRTALDMKSRMFEHYYETISALMLMLQRSHPYTHGHLERVARLTEEVALRLGLPRSKARQVREAAVLHDIGKIAVDEEVLEKPGKLTDDEFKHVQLHAQYGADILEKCEQFGPLVKWIRSHHERPDGAGYPDRLQDAEIPIESKIIAVADAFDAMVGGSLSGESRPYREPMTIDMALAELERCSGSQFDNAVVSAFKEVVMEQAE